MDSWTLTYDGFDAAEESLREALTSTGNGYFCARGAAEWEESRSPHYPATYAHGVYNRESTIMGGRPVPNEDLVALPNWLSLQLRIEGEEPLRLEDVEVLAYRHGYDARRALVWRELRFRDRAGRETALHTRRFVSMARLHQGAIAWDITPEGWSGAVELVSAIDGRVTNRGVGRYAKLESRHLDPVAVRRLAPDVIALKARTRQSSIEVAEAARTRVYMGAEEVDVVREDYQTDDYIQQLLGFEVHAGETTRAEKMVALYTSHDRAIDEPLANAGKSVDRYLTFDEALDDHERAWEGLWRICDMRFPGDERVQFPLRFHAAHVLQVCSPFTALHDAGVPARGLNGEAYRGHVFWDELYVYPFLNHRLPEITRELLMYRYRRLDEARSAAIRAGYRGAMYPWQSGSDGREETQIVHLNPLSGTWDPDISHLQRHVNSAIFFNVWSYWQATGNVHFLRDYGAQMMLQIARFWASIAHRNPERGRWEIHGVMGPDEFHTRHPGAAEPGLRNNAYTNVMAAWVCETVLELLDLLPAGLQARLGVTGEEIRTWSEMSTGMFVPFQEDGVISQFEGWEDLQELDWETYRARYDNLQRLDRILRAEGDDPNNYKVTKQADTLMLFFLLSEERLAALFRRLGYEHDAGMARRNVEYYTERTTNGSTLSFVTNAAVLAPIDAERSWGSFRLALNADLGDVQGGTSGEGIHMGLMSGTLDLMQRAYAGTEIQGDVLRFAPRLLDRIDGLSFPMQFRGTYLTVTIKGGWVTVAAGPDGSSRPISVAVGDEQAELGPGDSHSFRGGAVTPFAACILDVDGVLVDSPHERAWRETLASLMDGPWRDVRERTSWAPDRFSGAVYQRVVAGKPRLDGARAALEHFDVPDAARRAEQYAALKQRRVEALIEAGEFTAFDDGVGLVLALRAAGIPLAAASSSRNADALLGRVPAGPGATLLDHFGVDESGRAFPHGKPAPDIFLAAAADLGVAPAACVVVEDAPAGIRAAKEAGMGAIGVARDGDEGALQAAGADLVVRSLAEVDVAALPSGVLRAANYGGARPVARPTVA